MIISNFERTLGHGHQSRREETCNSFMKLNVHEFVITCAPLTFLIALVNIKESLFSSMFIFFQFNKSITMTLKDKPCVFWKYEAFTL